MKTVLAFIVLALSLAGCSRHTQTTSGQEYLSQYSQLPRYGVDKSKDRSEEAKSIDERVREVAAVEPILKFPARIGLARIDGGRLTTLPVEEADSWKAAGDKLGKKFGEFIPVNPIIARMVAGDKRSSDVNGIIDVVRLGAARQHLDAVLIYEVIAKEKTHTNILAAANASILGGYILPSKRHEAEGLGNALLIDVMQGYPYGAVEAVVEKQSRMASSWGWGSEHGDREEMAAKIKAQAAKQLAEESYEMFTDLRVKLAEKRTSR